MMIVQFLLTVIIAAILYSGGEPAADAVRRFSRRLAGQQGDDVTVLAARAIRGVALGVVGTALIQSVLGGIGLAVSGVPAAAVLTAIMFILCIAQLGPVLVLVPAVIWLYWSGQTLWGTVLLAFTIVAATLDNFLRPYLIKKGADLPLLLIFAGVIGGPRCLRDHRTLHRAGGPCGDVYPARGLGGRRRTGSRPRDGRKAISMLRNKGERLFGMKKDLPRRIPRRTAGPRWR